MRFNKRTSLCGFTSIILAAGLGQAPAYAEEATATLEEIVVSAQKRDESLQEVPISVQVVSGETLQNQGVVSLLDFSQTTPGIKITRGASQNNLYVRGIGPGNNASLEQSVVRFVDDVYDGRGKGVESQMLDIERVEVLKGPQTTYFGGNAIGGAFNIVTRKPSNGTDGYMRVFYTPDVGGYEIEGAQNLPVTDSFRLRLAAMGNGMSRGWLTDEGAKTKTPQETNSAVRLSSAWDITDKLNAAFRLEYSDRHQQGSNNSQLYNCPQDGPVAVSLGATCATAIDTGQNYSLSSDKRSNTPGQMLSVRRNDYAATLNYNLGFANLTSVTGYTDYDFVTRYDGDGLVEDLLGVYHGEKYRQFSQELRLTSSGKNRFDYMAGLYYQHSDLNVDQTVTSTFRSSTISANPAYADLVPYLPLGQRALWSVDADTYSAFGVLTWNMTEALSLSGGFRASEVRKHFLQTGRVGHALGSFDTIELLPDSVAALALQALRAVNTDYDALGKYHRLSPSAKLQYQVTPDVMAYATYTDGFKSGGFQGNNFSGDLSRGTFKSETVNAYEVGVKSEWFDHRVLADVSVFLSDYSNLQVAAQINNGGGFVQAIDNAASARSQGIETAFQWAVNEHWRTGLNATFLDSKYGDYPNAPVTPWQQAQGMTLQDLSGKSTSQAPDISASWTLQYTHPLPGDLAFRADSDVFYTSDIRDGLADPVLRVPSYVKVGSALTLINNRTNWEFSLVGRNLTDKRVRAICPGAPLSPGAYFCTMEDPRMISIQARTRW